MSKQLAPAMLVQIVEQVSLGILPAGNPAVLLPIKCAVYAG